MLVNLGTGSYIYWSFVFFSLYELLVHICLIIPGPFYSFLLYFYILYLLILDFLKMFKIFIFAYIFGFKVSSVFVS